MTFSLVTVLSMFLFLSACAPSDDPEQAYLEGDYQRAYDLWMQRAGDGDAGAQNRIAMLYYLGQGVDQDYREARQWYERAAKSGHPGAQRDLGLMYESGRLGSRDFEKAYMWLYAAYQQGNENAEPVLQLIAGQLSPSKVRLLKQDVKPYIKHDVVDPENDDY